ncbi:type IV pilus, mannose-sensitive hemagglutinin protein MshF [Aliivibrio salmonicida]|uniref:type IV pilus, mannose-sensitive hemagglutinin protein MshF n=1 Tax=Aliivibrio salmonicida TaxID=40269 RepID=UPI00406CD362
MKAIRISWMALFVILLAVILFQWDKMEPEVEDTALMMTSREILSSANEFKNYWVVDGQPTHLTQDGIEVTFSRLGWPVVFDDNGDLDCQQWLHLLLPKKDKIYVDNIKTNNVSTNQAQYRCEYGVSNGKIISVMLNNGAFKVSIGSLNEN